MRGCRISPGFNPRPPRGGRLEMTVYWPGHGLFQSAPPTRGATGRRVRQGVRRAVSIRAPHAGGDLRGWALTYRSSSFNPRPPRGGRPAMVAASMAMLSFQSAPPTRGATGDHLARFPTFEVSIRAPHAGGDFPWELSNGTRQCFNPRPPRGGRLFARSPTHRHLFVSIRAPHAGGDTMRSASITSVTCFNPRPPRGGRRVIKVP